MAKKILIVDDEKPLASVLNLKLTNAGFETVVVYNGEDALKLLKEAPYDLALIDIMMPKRDGFSVIEELQKTGNPTPVFALSNLGQEEDVARVKSLGAKEYIMKTDVSPAEILAKVMAFLGTPEQIAPVAPTAPPAAQTLASTPATDPVPQQPAPAPEPPPVQAPVPTTPETTEALAPTPTETTGTPAPTPTETPPPPAQ